MFEKVTLHNLNDYITVSLK